MEITRLRWYQQRRVQLLLVSLVVLLGLAVTVFFSVRAINSTRQLRYIQEQGLDDGTAQVEAVRAWMTMRFIAVAYAVPEEYLYDALQIPFDRRIADRPIGWLNEEYGRPAPVAGEELKIVFEVRDAITAYRANPVVTGLRDVRPWMSIRYIANSTGVAEATLFGAINLPATGNESKPLQLIAEEQNYPGGTRALIAALLPVVPGVDPPPSGPDGERGPERSRP
jgi:hypothetical protein